MTPYKARAIWDPLVVWPEGYLDAAVRVEQERPLSRPEREAIDTLYAEFVEAMRRAGAAIHQQDTDRAGGRG